MELIAPEKQRTNFFSLFEAAARNNLEGARLLEGLCNHFADAEAQVAQLHELEHKGDLITHGVYTALNQTFIPPLDREDIIAIATSLDNVMDHIHKAGDAMCVYNVTAPTPIMCSLAAVIVACTQQVANELPLGLFISSITSGGVLNVVPELFHVAMPGHTVGAWLPPPCVEPSSSG